MEPPGIDSLPRFDVWEEEGQVVVRVPEDVAPMRTSEMAGRDPDDDRTFVVLGAGSAGAYAVEALRAAGFGGRLVIITQEPHPPYDRPNCSKAYLAGEAEEAWMFLRTPDFYEARDIELLTSHTATEVDAASKTIAFADGTTMQYDALLLCTGGRPRTLDVPGADLDGIHTLRSYDDSRTGEEVRIEHWRLAGQHGRLAGHNMAGQRRPYRSVPFFWTRHFGTSFQYMGHAMAWDEVLYDGDPADRSFIAYFVAGDRIRAVAGAGRGKELAAIQHLMREERMPAPGALRSGSVDLVERLRA